MINTFHRSNSNLQSKQKEKRLDAVESSVDKVTHEQVVRLGHVASDFEEFLQIVELTVDVSAYLR